MSTQKTKSIPDLSITSIKYLEAISQGNDYFKSWQYNVADHLKSKSVDEIKLYLKSTALPFSICMENWISDFNFSSLVRNANGFNAKEVFYIGNRKFDRRGCMGTHNYISVNWLSSFDELLKLKEKYVFVGVDNINGSKELPKYKWAPNSLMILGSEDVGLTQPIIDICDDIVSIPMLGSVRSYNAACASMAVMYDYYSKL